jgi:carbon monoxide dehydrogenase subunit G
MELSGRRLLPVDRATAWRALNDPAVLCRAVPGCESLEPTGANEYAAVLAAAIGPVRARFKGKLRLEDVVEPSSYTLRFEGDGGAAGFAKGVARVKLADEGKTTALDYTVSSQVGGKLAQVGNRLVDSVARKLADEFFAALDAQLRPQGAAAEEAPPTVVAHRRPWTSDPRVWIGIFIAAVLLLLLLRLTLR